jgi:hypothetical protein
MMSGRRERVGKIRKVEGRLAAADPTDNKVN